MGYNITGEILKSISANKKSNTHDKLFIIKGKVEECSLESLLNKESTVIYEELKGKKEMKLNELCDSIYKIIKSIFKYDFNLNCPMTGRIPESYTPPKNYTIEGVCRHGAKFASALIESLAPKARTCIVPSLVDFEKKIYHGCAGITIDNNFYIFNAFSSNFEFGLVEDEKTLSKLGLFAVIKDGEKIKAIPKISYESEKIVEINYSQKKLKIFRSEKKTVLSPIKELGEHEISLINY